MKKIFFLLLITNLLLAALQFFQPTRQEIGKNSAIHVVNPEKIILLPTVANCIEWGDFSGPDSIESAETAIQTLDLGLPYRLALSAPLIQYRLHTAPFTDQQTVEREINKFRNMGIISYRIMDQGHWFNAISFGEFTGKQTAQALQKKLNAQEITGTIISEQVVEQKKFLFFETNIHEISALQSLAQQFPGSKLTQATCERL
ncbi:hypothetical protein SAMN05421690_10628 [Nitrosomonas sp. Nm51]|uniref:SPOR domain-containing protein n=1 Tax=Nitrosomonas sp. Nm51 TaxID=133720 RepID=UPI0008B82829|nr:SPOR domain-containing protein [Nitrosomonas sp. Nm51]SER73464.1 hypothetical protein SAMN05421690_10628 [Nitrosomonas sp. Nm51]